MEAAFINADLKSSIPEPSEHESVRIDRQSDVRFQAVAYFGSDDSLGSRIIATSN
jgi:hypothetical protein